MKTKTLLFLLLFSLAGWKAVFAQPGQPGGAGMVMLTGEQDKTPLGLHLEILEDPSGKLSIEDVTSPELDGRFVPSDTAVPSYGFTDSAYWVRFRVRNDGQQAIDRLLELGFANMHFADLYQPGPDGAGYVVKQTGTLRPFDTRALAYHHIVFPLSFPDKSEQTFYLRFQSGASMTLPLTFWSSKAFLEMSLERELGLGIFYGALLIILVYNLFLFWSSRERAFLYFDLCLAAGLLTMVTYDGLGAQYLWSGQSSWQGVLQPVFFGLFMASVVKFADVFLETASRAPRMHRLLTALLVGWAVLVLVTPLAPYKTLVAPLVPLAVVSVLVVISAGVMALRQHYRPARFFLLSWTVLFLGLVTVLMLRLGLIESSPFSEDFWRVGMLWLVAMWSVALADRLNVLKADMERAYRALRNSQTRLAQIIETMPLGVVVYGADMRPQLLNQRARQSFGIPEQDAPPDSAQSPTIAETANAYSFRVAGTEEAYPVDRLPVVRALHGEHAVVDDLEMDSAGNRIQLEAWAGPIVDDQGNILSAVAAFQDITQRKQAEADLKQHREHLEELVAARTAELSALNQIAHALVTTEDLPSTLDSVVREIAQLFGVALTVVGVVETGEARVVAATYPHQDSGLSEVAYPLGDNSILCPLLDEGRALIVPNIQDRIESPFWRERVHAWNIHAVMLIPLLVHGEVIGFMAVGAEDPERCFTAEELALAETIAADVAGAVENVRLSEQAQKAATFTERNRLAQELHDSVTQLLYSVATVAEAVPDLWERYPDEARRGLKDLRQLARAALAEMRILLLELRPSALMETELGALLYQLSDAMMGRTRISITTSASGERPLPGDVQLALYRIAQESLNNVVKHAAASQATVGLYFSDDDLLLRVSDDGRGFELQALPPGRLGIGIMAERARAIGADFQINSEVGKGTEVRVVWTDRSSP